MDDRHFASAGTISLAGGFMLVSVLLMLTPINLFGGYVPSPMFPLYVIFLYGLDRPASLAPWVTFVAGLLHDLLFGPFIGPWATVYLFMHAAIYWQRSYFAGRDVVVLATGFGITALVSLLLYWFEMSILSSRLMPLNALLIQWLVTVLVFPIALVGFRRTIGRQRPSLLA